ncbi:MAG TPA: hypothetical protein VK862_11940 [Afifellaceae bacterium]|nr:hypothetical protein [Afifellaceae bacterium]
MGPGAYGHGFGVGPLIFLIGYILVFIVPTWKIVSRAGFSGAWSLLALIPLVNVIMLWVFAFARWPNVNEG